MRDLKGYQAIGIIGMVLILVEGCSLDEPAPMASDPPLTLSADHQLSITTLHWDTVKVTGFKEYILLQSASDIPNAPVPQVNADVSLIKRINDVDITSWTVPTVVSSPHICYKLYCAVDDRFLYSSTLCIDQTFTTIEGFYDNGCHEKGVDEMLMFDRVNSLLSSLDYKTGTITKSVNDNTLTFPSMDMSAFNGTVNMYVYDQSPGKLRKYDIPELTSTVSKSYNQILWAANAYDQFVFVAVDEGGKNFQVLNRNTLSVLDSRTGMTGNRNIAVFPGTPLIVYELTDNGGIRYAINTNGKIIEESPVSDGIIQPALQNICAEGSQLFIGGRQGTIINKNGERLGFLNSDINSFLVMSRLTPDEKKAVYILNNNVTNRLLVADLTGLPALPILKTYDIPVLNYADVLVEEDIIYVIGTTFGNSIPQTFILKYPL